MYSYKNSFFIFPFEKKNSKLKQTSKMDQNKLNSAVISIAAAHWNLAIAPIPD